MTRPLFKPIEGWMTANLEADPNGEAIIEVGSGGTPSTEDMTYWGGTVLWLTPKEITENNSSRYVHVTERTINEKGLEKAGRLWPVGTVMLTKRAPVGFVKINQVPMATNQGILCFRCGDKLKPEYLYYWLLANTPYLDAVANGSTYPELYPADLFEFEICLPPLPEQNAIVYVLGSIDDKIELNYRMNKTLEEMAQSIFRNWFIDFEPFYAQGLQDSVIGQIPIDWEVEKLNKAIELRYGKGLTGSARHEGDIPVYGSNGQVGWHNEKLVEGPGIVVGRKGNPGIVTWVPCDFFPIDTTFYVVGIGPIQSMYYLYFALKNMGLPSISADSAVPGLNRNLAYMNDIIVPPTDSLRQFDILITPLFKKCYENEQENRALSSIRDALLPTLISGEVRVKDAEKFVGEIL